MEVTWYNKDSERFMSAGYLEPHQGIEDRIQQIAKTAQVYLKNYNIGTDEWYNKCRTYISKGYFSLASPIWTNFGKHRSGLPISCNGTYVPDSMVGIMNAAKEVAIQTKHGSGCSIYVNKLRAKTDPLNVGGFSSGPSSMCEIFDTIIQVVSQGNVRRGNLAAYIDITHSDIEDFFQWRKEGSQVQNLSWGITVPDVFMNSLMNNPSEHQKEIWKKVIHSRVVSGYPYILFSDNMTRHFQEEVLGDIKISEMPVSSNLCSEIILPLSEDKSFVCCLSSMNVAKIDEWKNTDAVEVLAGLLNAVLDEYVEKAKFIEGLENCVRFTQEYRAIGIGQLGLCDYLQQNDTAFKNSSNTNKYISSLINNRARKFSEDMYASVPKKSGTQLQLGRANLTLTAVAPTTSSSFILEQTSPSIEPLLSNYFIKDLAKGKFTFWNKNLMNKAENYYQTQEEIDQFKKRLIDNRGSVQNEAWLNEHEKEVYKCFYELDMRDIIDIAADRRKYIDQSQSLNLMYTDVDGTKIHSDIVHAWKRGVITLYYHRGASPVQAQTRRMQQMRPAVEQIASEGMVDGCQVCSS